MTRSVMIWLLRLVGWLGGSALIFAGIAWGIMNTAPENISLEGHLVYLFIGVLGFAPFVPLAIVCKSKKRVAAYYVYFVAFCVLWLSAIFLAEGNFQIIAALLLTAFACPIIELLVYQSAFHGNKRPNQALLPTPTSVTDRAGARSAPDAGATDL